MCVCVCGARAHTHTGIWILKPCLYQREEEEGKKEKKLQHISGIFQLMMCGCGSTGEREPLTVLSLFRSPRAPCCIPVHCAYFGNSCSAPFFCLTVYSLCAALALFFPALCLSLAQPLPFSPLASPSDRPSLPSLFLSWLGQSYCCDCKLSFLQNKRKKEGK